MIGLARNWAKDQRKFSAAFDIFRNGQLPVYLVSFLEGTRISPDKVQRVTMNEQF